MTQTKAEQLADRLVQTSSLGTILICNSAADERRLSQIEAQNMKSPSHVHTWCTKDQVDVIAEKISRLAPMEAERDKLLAVNKALVEAFEKQLRSIPALQDGGGFVIDHLDCSGEYIGSQNIDPLQVVQELCSIANAALKLAGEIK